MTSNWLKQKAYEHGQKCALRWLDQGSSIQETWDTAIDWNPWTEVNVDCVSDFIDGVRLIVNAGTVVSDD